MDPTFPAMATAAPMAAESTVRPAVMILFPLVVMPVMMSSKHVLSFQDISQLAT